MFYHFAESLPGEIDALETLRRALAGQEAWICGLRRDQSVTRNRVEAIWWDALHGLHKICPIYDWSEDDVWSYIRAYDVAYNPLHDRGFKSIGRAPCTQASAVDEDIRAGRWWCESPEHKECGLHAVPPVSSGLE